jgi:RimJ/RimL family protein N-acetyltransferase
MTMIADNLTDHLPLTGTRIRLTALEAADMADLLPFFQDMASLAYYIPTTARPLNREQLDQLLADWNDGRESFVFAVRQDQKVVGLVNIDGLDWANSHAEIGIALTSPSARGQGYAFEALSLLIDFAFKELGLHRLWARIIDGNEPSLKLFARLGFKQEGRMTGHIRRRGEFRDMLILGLVK